MFRIGAKTMSSDASFVEYVRAQVSGAEPVSYRKMFGEYALYLDGKVVALVCDNQLFVRPSDEGRAILGRVREESPFPQAKPHFLIDDGLDDPELMQRLFAATARALPLPKPKRPKKSKSAS
jgi:TfoX/Sxy family transcriptional regulator of competence genes